MRRGSGTGRGEDHGGAEREPRSPWLVGAPLFAGALILGALWGIRREPIYLVFAVLVVAWAGLWVWGAARGRRADTRASTAPPYHEPRPGEAIVLGRARWRARGALRLPRAGVLLAGPDDLLWVAADLSRLGRIGQTVPLGALVAPVGGSSVGDGGGAGGPPQTVAALDGIQSYRMLAGAFGADTLTLRLRNGRTLTLRPLDPEVFVLLMEVFATRTSGR